MCSISLTRLIKYVIINNGDFFFLRKQENDSQHDFMYGYIRPMVKDHVDAVLLVVELLID